MKWGPATVISAVDVRILINKIPDNINRAGRGRPVYRCTPVLGNGLGDGDEMRGYSVRRLQLPQALHLEKEASAPGQTVLIPRLITYYSDTRIFGGLTVQRGVVYGVYSHIFFSLFFRGNGGGREGGRRGT